MKKYNGVIILLVIAVIVAVFVACSSKPAYSDKEVTITQAVTDQNGEAVTQENGEVVTEQVDAVVVTDPSGQTVTEVVTKKDGTEVTKPNGEKVTQAVTTIPSTTEKTTKKKDKETTNKNEKPSGTTSTTKKKDEAPTNKPSSTTTTTTTTTTEPTTLPPTTAVGEEEEKGDIKVGVVLPFFSDMDANSYNLYVKIGDDTLKFPISDGCRGQQIEINIPKEYKGKKATFSINVAGKKYNEEGTIKKGLKIEFETIIIVTGEDD